MFALIDCNNFFASCERVFQPQLRDKAIVVLSNNDGCVIARSNEAKALGVPMGAAAFKYADFFKQKDIHVFSSNYALYGDMSSRIMNLLREFSPDIEIYSIDEAFLKFDGFELHDIEAIGKKIRERVSKGTGIPVSVGIAPTKALSKVANRIAKKFPKRTKNVYVMDSDEKRIKALKWLEVGDVWGIGRQISKKLIAEGVVTAYDFTQLPDEYVRKKYSVVGLRLKHELEGKQSMDIEHYEKKKSIATTRTFAHMLTSYDAIHEHVSTFAVNCAEKLRLQKTACNMMMVFIETNRHRKGAKRYSKNIIVNTDFPSNSSIDLVKYASAGLKAIYKTGYEYKRAGVIVMGIAAEEEQQLNLFVKPNAKHKKLMQAMDHTNASLGQHKVKLASQNLEKKWNMRQEKLSPRYSTKLEEIICIHC